MAGVVSRLNVELAVVFHGKRAVWKPRAPYYHIYRYYQNFIFLGQSVGLACGVDTPSGASLPVTLVLSGFSSR
jgi:hypothetical protein